PKPLASLTKWSLASLALFVFTSMAASSLSHIFIAAPAFYVFYQKLIHKNFNPTWSQIGILGIVVLGVISILASPDIKDPVDNLSGLMHFAIGLLAIGAYRSTFYQPGTDNTRFVRIALTIFFVALIVANINGIIGLYTQYNPLRFREATD